MEKLKGNQRPTTEVETRTKQEEEEEEDWEADDDDDDEEQQDEAHVEPDGNCRLQTNGNPFKRPMNALQKQWYRVLLARRVGFGPRVMQDEKEVT